VPGRLRKEIDVLVAGGGAAGIATAVALAHRGLDVRVLERSTYGAPRVGEHLSPGCRPFLDDLGLWPLLLESGPLESTGVCACWGQGDPYDRDYVFGAHGNGWNLDRARFDETLARGARARGIEVALGSRPAGVRRTRRGWTVTVAGGPLDGLVFDARVLVDASGRSAALARALGARRRTRDRLVGLCGWLGTDDQHVGRHRRLLVEAVANGWWYSLALPGTRIAAVLMTDRDLVPAGGPERAETFWRMSLAEARHVAPMVRGCRLGFAIRAANSYALEPAAGTTGEAGWLAVGDAAMAIDPLSSMGILQALRSGREAAETIDRHLSGDARALPGYADGVARGFTSYLADRDAVYAGERRFSDSTFWRRRHEPRAAVAPGHL
jgi:flavin-dependent dehydrogenase